MSVWDVDDVMETADHELTIEVHRGADRRTIRFTPKEIL